jgi:hypothetical protein
VREYKLVEEDGENLGTVVEMRMRKIGIFIFLRE